MTNSESQWENPMGTAGFEFVEFSSPEPESLEKLFSQLGFTHIANHKSKNVKLFRQGNINFILNAQPGSYSEQFHKKHGPSACALGFRVQNSVEAYKKAVAMKARPHNTNPGFMELNLPCVEGVGGALLFFINLYGEHSIYEIDFDLIEGVRDLIEHYRVAQLSQDGIPSMLTPRCEGSSSSLFWYASEQTVS